MANITLEQALALLRGLSDSNESKESFRRVLSQPNISRTDLEAWVHECLSKTEGDYGFALQDIINEIGNRLGFEVENGLYRGKKSEIGFDGIWSSRTAGVNLVIETKKTTTYQIEPSKLGDYIEKLIAERKWSKDKVYGLYVVGDDSPRTFIDTIRGSEHRNILRVIPIPALLTLFKLKEEETLSHDSLVKFLVPMDAINLGELVFLVESIVTEQTISEETPRLPQAEEGQSPLTRPAVSRKQFESYPPGEVAVFPSKREGVSFLLKYNAWAHVHIRRQPPYFALYVGAPDSEIQYFGEIAKIIEPSDPDSPIKDNYREISGYSEGKKLILLKDGSVKRLEKPVPIGGPTARTRGLFYTSIEKLSKANTLDDLD